jgi:hypothetical protein
MIKTLARRIELAERAAAGRSMFSEDCICFPGPEPPYFFSDEEQEAAHSIKCRLHGDRFKKHFHLFQAPWRKECEVMKWKSRNARYKKAWLASGLPLWASRR